MPTRPSPYTGGDLGPRPHAAIIFRDQIGDFLVATPLMRGLRERFPGLTLDYFGGERTRELEEASSLVDARFSLYGSSKDDDELATFIASRRASGGPYDLAINLEHDDLAAHASELIAARFAVGAWSVGDRRRIIHGHESIDQLWNDSRWNRADLLRNYPVLETQFIGEIFCRLARVETDYTRTEAPTAEPGVSIPEVLVSTGANRPAKLWPVGSWLQLASWLHKARRTVGLLGAAPSGDDIYHVADADAALLGAGVHDLRGRLTLPQVAGALRKAVAVVTVDNGLMHLAGAVGTPTIALFGASPRRLWAPRTPGVRIVGPTRPCSACEENRFRNADCLLPVHQCMTSVEPVRVIELLASLLAAKRST